MLQCQRDAPVPNACESQSMPSRTKKAKPDTAPQQVDLMFRAFCDRTRLRILSLLLDGELCVGDIVKILQVPQPRVSRHLTNLKKSGLVVTRKTGLWVHYSLATPESEFHRQLLDCAVTCFKEVPEIKSDNARAAKIRKSGGCCPGK
jgi:ArsR family transcriptional regulator, arsenate/arsenite/antimonite-responsive transcriptional repressor